jgi:hypothetical protein
MKNTFLFRVYAQSRFLFSLAVIAIAATLYCAAIRTEQFPFLLYGMYSTIDCGYGEYATYSLEIGGKEIAVTTMCDAKQELVGTTMANAMGAENWMETREALAGWLKRYTGGRGEVKIYKLQCVYTAEGKLLVKKRELLYANSQH